MLYNKISWDCVKNRPYFRHLSWNLFKKSIDASLKKSIKIGHHVLYWNEGIFCIGILQVFYLYFNFLYCTLCFVFLNVLICIYLFDLIFTVHIHKILFSLSVFLLCFPVKISQHPEIKIKTWERNKIVYINACLKH